ncbi:MAG: HlyD family secretion protein [Deltaproteobacteria bacterium]|nr:MAG: HlyD family secretion protein [Deltaproteobacteria bacterium]
MEKSTAKANNRARMNRFFLLVTVVALASLLGGTYWFFVLRHRETTDNAYVMTDVARVSSRVIGTVLRVSVENDQPVVGGQVLLELDPRDYQAEVDQAKGDLARIEGEIRATETLMSLTDTQTLAKLNESEAKLVEARNKKKEGIHRLKELEKKRDAAQADLTKARRDFKRFKSLFETGTVAEEQKDRTHTDLVKAKAQVEAMDAEIDAAKASLEAVDQAVKQAQAQLRASRGDRLQVELLSHKIAALSGEREEARAKLIAAQLNLSYCTITAPISGYIAQKNLQVGDRVQSGQALMAVVPLEDVYVEANLKETQLEHIRLGQLAIIKADVYPNYTYHGKVVGVRAGTGASFSLLPPENATGNWIKVVQRVPVKIRLDKPPPAEYPLRLGLSLHVTISTRDQSGPRLLPLAPKP